MTPILQWIESAGARVAVIPFDAPEAELRSIFRSINGVLFPGGGLNLTADQPFFKVSKLFYELALEANLKGDYFPLWATCQGFQLVAILVAQDFSCVVKLNPIFDLSFHQQGTSDIRLRQRKPSSSDHLDEGSGSKPDARQPIKHRDEYLDQTEFNHQSSPRRSRSRGLHLQSSSSPTTHAVIHQC